MESNEGAAQARNTGLAQSFGDHSLLLDDDVTPDPDIISAYLGAIARHPKAGVLSHIHNLNACVALLYIKFICKIRRRDGTPSLLRP